MGKEQNKKKTAHIVSHTHWDREWRYPIWQTIHMLRDFIDELIEVLESGAYPGFLLDGQVIPVLDYLDMRPENKEAITKLIKSGKLEIGPWYILPDEFPVDGESLVRNLLKGFRAAEKLGKVTKLGYTPFGWGQTAQLPQIYAGFGIDTVLVGKKVNKDRAPNSEFIWRSPDGTELLTTRFGVLGRQNFYFYVHLSSLFGIDHLSEQWKYNWGKDGVAYHRCDTEFMEQDLFRLDEPKTWHPEYITKEVLDQAWETTDESVLDDDRLMMNGCDYTASQPMFPEMLKRINEVDKDSDRHWHHITMVEFVEMLNEKIDRSKLNVVDGALRDGPIGGITGNALATRGYIKQKNKKAENLLFCLAEPLSVMSELAGDGYDKSFIDKSLDYMLKSQPHDSINGVTQDKTVTDVMYRLDQSVELSQVVADKAIQNLVRRIDLSKYDKDSVLLVVFNSMPHSRREVVEAWVNMPLSDDLVEVNGVRVVDSENQSVPMQWSGSEDEYYPVAELHTRAFPYRCKRHRLFFDTGEIPACGYKVFKVCQNKKEFAQIEGVSDWSDNESQTSTLLTSPDSMENEFLRIEMNSNGTFDMIDKQNDKTYSKLNYYEDRGEHGTYWVNQRPMHDQVHTSLGCNARIWSQDSGPLQATLVSEIAMPLPTCGIPPQQRRGDKLEDMVIRTSITLKKGQKHVEVDVEVNNCHQDHYLRAMFPTNLSDATHADTGGHFIVDRRPIRPQGPTSDSVWKDLATLPQNKFVDLSDGKNGIAFINQGLTEYEVTDSKDRVVALSLFKAVKNWICTERVGSDFPSQKGGQSLGVHSFKYALQPHAGNWRDAEVLKTAEMFNNSVIPVQTSATEGTLPGDEMSFINIDNSQLGFSALKKAADSDSYVLRVYNPTDVKQDAVVTLPSGISKAWDVNLNEERQSEIAAGGKDLSFSVAPYKIASIEIIATK